MAKSTLIQQTSAGEPISVGEVKIYPVSRSYRVNFPAAHGGIVWNRPLSVIVEDSQGNRQIIQIQDRTRQLQIGILAAGFIVTFLTWLVFRQPR